MTMTIIDRRGQPLPDDHPLKGGGVHLFSFTPPNSSETQSTVSDADEEALSKAQFADRYKRNDKGLPLNKS